MTIIAYLFLLLTCASVIFVAFWEWHNKAPMLPNDSPAITKIGKKSMVTAFTQSNQEFEVVKKKTPHSNGKFIQKIVGLSNTGDTAFDQQFKVDMYNPELLTQLRTKTNFRDKIQKLFDKNKSLLSISISRNKITFLRDSAINELTLDDYQTIESIQQLIDEELSQIPSVSASFRTTHTSEAISSVTPVWLFFATKFASGPVTLLGSGFDLWEKIVASFCLFLVTLAISLPITKKIGFRHVVFKTAVVVFFLSIFSIAGPLSYINQAASIEVARIPVEVSVTYESIYQDNKPSGEISKKASVAITGEVRYRDGIPVDLPAIPNNFSFTNLQDFLSHAQPGQSIEADIVVHKGLLNKYYIKDVEMTATN